MRTRRTVTLLAFACALQPAAAIVGSTAFSLLPGVAEELGLPASPVRGRR
jgi:hypothetical protein